MIVHAVDDRRHERDVDSELLHVFDRPKLDVEEIADAAVRVGRVADAVKLQIRVAEAGFGRLLEEF